MADAPDIQADFGSPEQLPYGAATQLNEAVNTPPPEEPQSTTSAPAEVPTVMAQPADYQPSYTPATEEEQFLLGPSLRPDEPVTAGATARVAVPPDVATWYPAIVAASQAADAPPQLRALASILSYHLGS